MRKIFKGLAAATAVGAVFWATFFYVLTWQVEARGLLALCLASLVALAATRLLALFCEDYEQDTNEGDAP